MNGELAEMLKAAGTTRIGNTEVGEDQFVDANRERCRKASRDEMYCVLARYTSSEALTIVKSVTEMDGVGAWVRLHANCSRRTLGREGSWPSAFGDHAVGREVESWKFVRKM